MSQQVYTNFSTRVIISKKSKKNNILYHIKGMEMGKNDLIVI